MPNQNPTQDPQNAPPGQRPYGLAANQSDPTQNPNPVNPPVDQPASQISPPVSPTVFPQSNLPPLPPAFQDLPGNNTTTTTTTTTNNQPSHAVVVETSEPTVSQNPTDDSTGSSAPPDIPPMVSRPKKKFGGGKIIATILGFIVLIGGVGAGIVLTQQKQLINQKATSCEAKGQFTCNCKCYSTCVDGSVAGQCNAICAEKDLTCNYVPPTGGSCANSGDPLVDGCVGRSPGDTYCSPEVGGDGIPRLRTCVWAEPNNPNNHMCANTIGAACGPGNCAIDVHTGQYPPGCTPTPVPASTPPPTATPTPVPLCNSECTANNQCPSGLICSMTPGFTIGSCRNPSCTEAKVNCICSTPTPTPQVLSCVSLINQSTNPPKLGDTVSFTCNAGYSSVPLWTFFRYSSDGGSTYSDPLPAGGWRINAGFRYGYHTITIDKAGNWVVQCRICTSTDATHCTVWGQAS